MRDMFGNEITIEQARALKKRKAPVPNGYAAAPGTGPAGETCKTCLHLARVKYANVYMKCGLMKKQWTGGGATDVLARSPACRRWEPKPA